MCKVKGIAEKDPFLGYVVWINGNIVGVLYPLLNKYFRLEKEIFFPTFFYYETQKLNPSANETIYTAKSFAEYWQYYIEENNIFPLVFHNPTIPENYNTILQANHEYFECNQTLLWIYWLLAYFITRNPAQETIERSMKDEKLEEFLLNVNPDMNNLLRFIQENQQWLTYKNKNSQPIQIKTAYGDIHLSNKNNWFWQHLKEYIQEYCEPELVDDNSPRRGAPQDKVTNTIIIQLYRFFKDRSTAKDDNKISKGVCLLIIMFLHIIHKIHCHTEKEIEELRQLKKRSEGEEKEYYSNYLDMTKMQSEWIKLVRERIRDNMTVTDDSLVDWNFNILANLSNKEIKYW